MSTISPSSMMNEQPAKHIAHFKTLKIRQKQWQWLLRDNSYRHLCAFAGTAAACVGAQNRMYWISCHSNGWKIEKKNRMGKIWEHGQITLDLSALKYWIWAAIFFFFIQHEKQDKSEKNIYIFTKDIRNRKTMKSYSLRNRNRQIFLFIFFWASLKKYIYFRSFCLLADSFYWIPAVAALVVLFLMSFWFFLRHAGRWG